MIIPAILAHSQDELKKKIRACEKIVDLVHIDIMDGTLVPHTCFWDPDFLSKLRTPLHFELHLMVNEPRKIIDAFKTHSNIRRVYFHAECDEAPKKIIETARFQGFEIGMAINPETTTDVLEDYLYELDGVLIMGVNPGASGQKFIPETIEKIATFHHAHPKIEIQVDGGVSSATIRSLCNAGATRFAIGSALFDNPRGIKIAIKELNQISMSFPRKRESRQS